MPSLTARLAAVFVASKKMSQQVSEAERGNCPKTTEADATSTRTRVLGENEIRWLFTKCCRKSIPFQTVSDSGISFCGVRSSFICDSFNREECKIRTTANSPSLFGLNLSHAASIPTNAPPPQPEYSPVDLHSKNTSDFGAFNGTMLDSC